MTYKKYGFHISYDEIVDTLYINTGRPQGASSELNDDFIIIRRVPKRAGPNGKIAGVTITDYLLRNKEGTWKDSFIIEFLPEFKMDYLDKINQWRMKEYYGKAKRDSTGLSPRCSN